jgi:hypothetical protein
LDGYRNDFILSANNNPNLVVCCPNYILWPFRHVRQAFDPRVVFTIVAGETFQNDGTRRISVRSYVLPRRIFWVFVRLQTYCEDLGSYYHLWIMH